MGMFDTVRVEFALPDGFEGELQSKDGPCTMATFVLKEDGTMLCNDRAWWNKSEAETWRKVEYHGYFYFGGVEYPKDHVPGTPIKAGKLILHEYRAKYTDGKLVELVRMESLK